MAKQFWLALSFLTRLPVPKHTDFSGMTLAQAAWAFPLAGIMVGLFTGWVYALLLSAGIAPSMASWISLGFGICLTGGLHEDGLADTADGLAAGRTREQKLDIMRDSCIGSYGVMALVIVLSLRALTLSRFYNGYGAMLALAATAAGSRACMAMLMYMSPPARTDGLAVSAGKPRRKAVMTALLFGMCPFLLINNPPLLLLCMGVAYISCLTMSRVAQKHFGGITGDVLGATQQLCETLLMVILSSALPRA